MCMYILLSSAYVDSWFFKNPAAYARANEAFVSSVVENQKDLITDGGSTAFLVATDDKEEGILGCVLVEKRAGHHFEGSEEHISPEHLSYISTSSYFGMVSAWNNLITATTINVI